MKRRVLLLPFLAILPFFAHACAVPVYQYALESWPTAPYQVTIFQQGPLNAGQKKCLKVLREDSESAEKGRANYDVTVVDLAQNDNPEAAALWKKQQGLALPAMVVVYPDPRLETQIAWSGAFDATSVERLIDSPVRRELVKEIKAGNAAVWLFIESGSAERDRAALAALDKGFAQQAAYLKSANAEAPEGAGAAAPDNADAANATDILGPAPERPKSFKYAVVRLNPDAPAESVFARMLYGLLDGNARPAHPVAFPVFGRGRVLQPIEQETFTADTVTVACNFLTGDCSCMVKEQNPGVDLLLNAKWDDGTQDSTENKTGAPPLIGLNDLHAATTATAPGATAPAKASAAIPPAVTPVAVAVPQAERWWRGLVWAGAGALALLILATLAIWRRAQNNHGAGQ